MVTFFFDIYKLLNRTRARIWRSNIEQEEYKRLKNFIRKQANITYIFFQNCHTVLYTVKIILKSASNLV